MTDEANEFGGGQFGGQFSSNIPGNFKALIDDCLRSAGVTTSDTKYRERALAFATYAQLHALKGRHWRFLNRELYIDLTPPYNTGTVALTENSRSVVEQEEVGAAKQIVWNSTMVGSKFCPSPSDIDCYRILKVENSKSLELASVYAGTSAAPTSYKIIKDRYVLDAKIQKVKTISLGSIGAIKPVGLNSFRHMESANPCLTGVPEYYTIVHMEEDSGQSTIEFYPSPDKRYNCRIEYVETITTPEDSETCFSVIPPNHMDVLYFGILAEIYRYQNNPAMLQDARTQYQDAWRRFASDHDLVDPVARIQHGRNYFRRGRNRYSGFYGMKWFGKVED